MSRTDFSGAGYQPANHLSPSPVECGQSHPHHLQTHMLSEPNTFDTSTKQRSTKQRSTTKDLREQTNAQLCHMHSAPLESNADTTHQYSQFQLIEPLQNPSCPFIICNLSIESQIMLNRCPPFVHNLKLFSHRAVKS